MVNSSFVNILRKFSPKELKEFTEFVSSPFFNKNENVMKLLKYVKKYYPEFNEQKVEKTLVFKKLYPGKKYNDGLMRTNIHNLSRLAEDYLAYLNFISDPVQNKINLIKELNSRKLERILLKNYKDVEKELDKVTAKTENQYYKKYIAADIMHNYTNWSRFKAKHLKDFEENLMYDKMINLTNSYLLGVLSDYRILLWRMEYENLKVKMDFLDSIIEYLKTNEVSFNSTPGIILHLYEILLLKEKNTEYFFKLKDMLVNSRESLTHDQRYSLHNVLQNFAAKEIFNGNDSFKRERFELNKIAINQNLYKGSEDLYFDDILFSMMAFNATVVGEHEWAEKFIEKYKQFLAPENFNIVVNVAQARLNISKGDFKKALNCLNDIKAVKHIQYKYPVKDLMLMVFYELSIYPQAYYQLDTYRHFINKYRNYFPKDRIERITNFMKFYSRLIKQKENFMRENFEILKQEIEKCPNIMNRDWIVEKINELDNFNV